MLTGSSYPRDLSYPLFIFSIFTFLIGIAMSQNKLYVGNISYDTTQDSLRDAFGQFGDISEVKLITDRETGRSKGFAFITFAEVSSARSALDLNGTDLDGRTIKVSEAKDNNRSGGGGRGGRDGGNRRW